MQTTNSININYIAKKHFNLNKLYPLQELAIKNILRSCNIIESNEDKLSKQLVILPTGFGKSICYMLPGILMKTGFSLAIYPLHSLIEDQKKSLKSANINYYEFTGKQNKKEKQKNTISLNKQKHGFILTTPESFISHDFLKNLTKIKLNHIIIDEAHIIKQWGETFRPAYLKLKEIIIKLSPDMLSAFTATATKSNIDFIKENLFANNNFSIINKNPDRPNIRYKVINSISKDHDLKLLLNKQIKYPLLIFCRSRLSTEILARKLREFLKSDSIYYYHAGLENNEKRNIENWFMNSQTGILTATCAYGMGVNKKNIRTVIHYEPPPSIEEYLQESGRAGRDKKIAEAIIIHNKLDEDKFLKITLKEDPEKFEAIKKYLINTKCRRNFLLKYMGYVNTNCKNCLVCTKTENKSINGFQEIYKLIKKYNKKLTKNDAICILKGSNGYYSKERLLYMYKYFGLLHNWDKKDIKKAIEYFINKAIITEKNKGLHKYKLVLNNDAKSSEII